MSRAWPDGRGLTVTMTVAALLVLPIAIAGGSIAAVAQEPAILLGGLAIALLSSTIRTLLELAALRRLSERDLRRPDEPGAGRRRRSSAFFSSARCSARQRWWRSSSSAWPAPARASRHAPSRSFPRSWSPREAACRSRGSARPLLRAAVERIRLHGPRSRRASPCGGGELGLRRRSYECSAEMLTRGTPRPMLRAIPPRHPLRT